MQTLRTAHMLWHVRLLTRSDATYKMYSGVSWRVSDVRFPCLDAQDAPACLWLVSESVFVC